MIENSIKSLYVGITTNPENRLETHNQKQGATFTRHGPKYRLVFLEKHIDISSARRRERQIKKWRREKKEFLIEQYIQGKATLV